MCGFIAQLVEHRTGIAEVTGSNPVEALIFFQASSFQLLKLENLLRWSLFTLIHVYVNSTKHSNILWLIRVFSRQKKCSGHKINFFSGSHLAPKYFKVVANTKKLVVIMTNTQTTVSHQGIQSLRSELKIWCTSKYSRCLGHKRLSWVCDISFQSKQTLQ